MNDTKTKPTDQKESTLNPEIKEKAKELFDLLEDEIDKSHEDELAEAMSEQLGDFIKNSKGFDQLLYAYEISRTASERAVYGIEESAWNMNDEAFSILTELYKSVLDIAEIWNTPKEERDEWADSLFNLRISEAESAAEKVSKATNGLWRYRAEEYREELAELKGDK